jgi:hypothetical protein
VQHKVFWRLRLLYESVQRKLFNFRRGSSTKGVTLIFNHLSLGRYDIAYHSATHVPFYRKGAQTPVSFPKIHERLNNIAYLEALMYKAYKYKSLYSP